MSETTLQPRSQWFLYLLECADGSVYTGITTDVERRFEQHRTGTGARYTRSRAAVALVGSMPCADRSEASRLEAAVKRLRADRKRQLGQLMQTGDTASVIALLALPGKRADLTADPQPAP